MKKINGSVSNGKDQSSKFRFLCLFLLLTLLACRNTDAEPNQADYPLQNNKMLFSKAKWATKIDSDYPYREELLIDLIKTDTLKSLDKRGIFAMLGKPNREDNNHLFYRISEKRIGFFPLNTKTLVIKMANDTIVEWVKIHQ